VPSILGIEAIPTSMNHSKDGVVDCNPPDGDTFASLIAKVRMLLEELVN